MLERLIGDWREATAAGNSSARGRDRRRQSGDCGAWSRLCRHVRRGDEPFGRCGCVPDGRGRFSCRDLGAACAPCCVAPPGGASRLIGEGVEPLAHRRSVLVVSTGLQYSSRSASRAPSPPRHSRRRDCACLEPAARPALSSRKRIPEVLGTEELWRRSVRSYRPAS